MEIDEDQEHYTGWMQDRADGRRKPVTEISPETPWVGGREGMYVIKQPTWLNKVSLRVLRVPVYDAAVFLILLLVHQSNH